MRSVLSALLLLVCACAHAEPAPSLPRCPESDRTACSSGPLVCKVDEKQGCDLCKCQSEVF